MQLSATQVLELYQLNKADLLSRGTPQAQPTAIILGGQPACGKSGIIDKLTQENPAFVPINGDDYRSYHPDFEKIIRNHPQEFPIDTQNFSNIFTENLIRDAALQRFSMVIEGTMRNPAVPAQTAALLRLQGYKVGVAVIAAHPKITELGAYRRYAEQLQQHGFGRLADITSHNAACTGLLTSIDTLYSSKAVDFIEVYAYLAKRKIAEYHLVNGAWDNAFPPALTISRERTAQIRNAAVLKRHVALGNAAICQLGNVPAAGEVKKIVSELAALQNHRHRQRL
jgi:hypothetical protein